MGMKFAFSSPNLSTADAPGVLARAREAGYDGVELAAPADPVPFAQAARSAGIEIACLASKFEIPAKIRAREKASGEVKRLIEAAAAMECPHVRLGVGVLRRGQSAGAFSAEVKDWLMVLGDLAGEQRVTLLLNNAPPFARARDLWGLLDLVNHRQVAASWDLGCAAGVGERPYVAVPTLNSRIRYVVVREGEAGVENLFDRLRGIGYGGYVAVQSSPDAMGTALARVRAAAGLANGGVAAVGAK